MNWWLLPGLKVVMGYSDVYAFSDEEDDDEVSFTFTIKVFYCSS